MLALWYLLGFLSGAAAAALAWLLLFLRKKKQPRDPMASGFSEILRF